MTILEQFRAARKVSVPLLVVQTADQWATAELIRTAACKKNDKGEVHQEHAVLQYDATRGLTVVPDMDGKLDAKSVQVLTDMGAKEGDTVRFEDAMSYLLKTKKVGQTTVPAVPRGTIIVVHNAHRQVMSTEPLAVAQNIQAIANLRDAFKQNFRMLVLMAPIFVAPSELEHDLVTIKHELPTAEELEQVVRELHVAAKVPVPDKAVLQKAADAASGLSLFAAEQQISMSLRPQAEGGLDLVTLWERKRTVIEQTRGLRVWRGTERFADLIGLDNVKAGLRQQLKSKMGIGAVVFIDEIDKVLANVEQDTSGVRMDQLRTLLTEMENNEWLGTVLMGVAGGGKSAIAKAFGNEAGVPTIALDLGDMEAPHVGESEALLRHAMEVIKRIGHGRAFFLATSNNASVMRPELQRRFTEGMFFFDLMSEQERQAAWAFYMKKYELKAQPMPEDYAWTAAEIRNCCRRAWNVNVSLMEASQFIVPMAQSRGEEINKLREYAHGRFLDATKPGTYTWTKEPTEKLARNVRAIDLSGVPGLVGVTKES